MNASPSATMPHALPPAAVVDEFLRLLMIPDPAECAAFNAARDRWMKKRIEGTDTVAGGTAEATVVYRIGTLYGEWPDGVAFEGNRSVDRYVLSHGLFTRMEVWNDSAEWPPMRAGRVAA